MTIQNQNSKLSEKINLDSWGNNSNMGNSHIILHTQESLPDIYSIKRLNISIAMGKIVIRLDDKGDKICSPGKVIDVPPRTKMKIRNLSLYKTAVLVMN